MPRQSGMVDGTSSESRTSIHVGMSQVRLRLLPDSNEGADDERGTQWMALY